MRRLAVLPAVLVAVLGLSGCIAAIPLAAGGAILQSRMKERPAQTAQAVPANDVDLRISPDPLPPMAGTGPVDMRIQSPSSELVAYALDRAAMLKSGKAVASALLRNPSSLEPERRECSGGLPAVLVDIDPPGQATSFDPPFQPSPSLAGELAQLRAGGVAVFWISRNGPDRAAAMRTALVDSGLDPQGSDGLVLMRFPAERKQDRRQDLGDTICLLAIAGGERGDFDELYDYLKQQAAAQPLEPMYGDGWFLIAPPLAVAPAPAPVAEPETPPQDTPTEDDTDALEP